MVRPRRYEHIIEALEAADRVRLGDEAMGQLASLQAEEEQSHHGVQRLAHENAVQHHNSATQVG